MPSVVPACWYILLFGTCLLRGALLWLLVVCCAWYRLMSSCGLQSIVLPRYSCRSSIVVGRACWSYRLVAPPAVGCRACSLLLSVVLSCLLLVVVLSCLEWPPPGPRGYLQAARLSTIRRGGNFSKRGEVLTETHPVPIFMREVKKNVVFQRKNVGNGENLRKRKRE